MPNTEQKLNIHQKILKIADAAGVLQKTKNGYNYKYVPEEEIQAKVTAGMQKYGVMLYNSIVPGTLKVQQHTYEKYDNKTKTNKTINEFVVSADTVYTWVNVENPTEEVQVPWAIVGQMEDASQGFGAAETYCNRYFLMKSLQLATSESDPDEYRSKQKEAENYEEQKFATELATAIKDIVDMGTNKIKAGVEPDSVKGIVAKHNNGNENPSSIKDIEICKKVLEELTSLKPQKTQTQKGDKQ